MKVPPIFFSLCSFFLTFLIDYDGDRRSLFIHTQCEGDKLSRFLATTCRAFLAPFLLLLPLPPPPRLFSLSLLFFLTLAQLSSVQLSIQAIKRYYGKK
jgi:hypothetical protein